MPRWSLPLHDLALSRVRAAAAQDAPPAVNAVGPRSVAIACGVCAVAAWSVWLGGELAGWIASGHWPAVPASDVAGIVLRLGAHPFAARRAWPRGDRVLLPPGPLVVAAVVASAAATGAAGFLAWRAAGSRMLAAGTAWSSAASSGIPDGAARWARHAELGLLGVGGAERGRVVLGVAGRRLLAAERGQSVIVVGPTQTQKTVGFAVPAILEWDGPVVATSVKTDLVRQTLAWRARRGKVAAFDPAGVTGLESALWSPVAAARTWPAARRMAADLVGAARSAGDGIEDAGFWYAMAAKLLAPLLLAAAVSFRDMDAVLGWIDGQESAEVLAVLDAAGALGAHRAALASFGREERQRASIYATAESVVEPYRELGCATPGRALVVDPAALTGGGCDTLYICAPAHDQRRLRPVFTVLVEQVMAAAFTRSGRASRGLDPPLLVVLDEAANIAPVADLDGLAATAASHGIQLVTVFQDLAQVSARYGERAATVVNNHRAKVFLSGISDPPTLDHVSRLLGDQERAQRSRTSGPRGSTSWTEATSSRPLLAGAALRRMRPGSGVLLYGHLPPAHLKLRPWFADATLSRRAGSALVVEAGPAARWASAIRLARRVRRAATGGHARR